MNYNMNRNNATRNKDLRTDLLVKRATQDLRWDLRNRKWSPKTLVGFISTFILDPEQ
jgi:hypothetical protein